MEGKYVQRDSRSSFKNVSTITHTHFFFSFFFFAFAHTNMHTHKHSKILGCCAVKDREVKTNKGGKIQVNKINVHTGNSSFLQLNTITGEKCSYIM